jgi:hypothetical protein
MRPGMALVAALLAGCGSSQGELDVSGGHRLPGVHAPTLVARAAEARARGHDEAEAVRVYRAVLLEADAVVGRRGQVRGTERAVLVAAIADAVLVGVDFEPLLALLGEIAEPALAAVAIDRFAGYIALGIPAPAAHSLVMASLGRP